MTSRGGMGGGGEGGGYTDMHVAGSLCCIAKPNTALYSSYPSVKKNAGKWMLQGSLSYNVTPQFIDTNSNRVKVVVGQ